MNNTGRYSIYRNGRARVGLHLLFWLLLYVFLLSYQLIASSTYIGFFSLANLALSLKNLLPTIIIYYFIIWFIYPLIKERKWLLIVFSAIALLFIAFLLPHFALAYLRYIFPTNKSIITTKYSERIFSYISLSLLFDQTIWYVFLAIAIKLIKDFYEEYKERLILIDERNKVELSFLRAQIKPHFLFNALNSVYGLSIDNDRASGMVLRLSNLLRYTLYNKNNNEIMLREEIALLTDYIELEKLRHKEDKVVIEYDFSKIDDDTVRIKPLILSGILQYAFAHSGKEFFIDITLSERITVMSLNISSSRNVLLNEEDTDWQNIERILAAEYPEKYLLENKNGDIKLVLNLQKDST